MLLSKVAFVLPTLLMFSAAYAADIRSEIRRAATKVGVPPELLSAICYVESKHKPNAFVYSDGTGNNHAFGACQVLHGTAKHFGFRDDRCYRDFRGKAKGYRQCKLFGYYTNSYYAAKYLKYQLDRYDGSWTHAIAAYNTGTVKICKTGWLHNAHGKRMYRCKIGGIINVKYVDKVIKALEENR